MVVWILVWIKELLKWSSVAVEKKQKQQKKHFLIKFYVHTIKPGGLADWILYKSMTESHKLFTFVASF